MKKERNGHLSMLLAVFQRVKTASKGEEQGCDDGKIKGCKCQIEMDTNGNLHQVVVSQATMHDVQGRVVWADILLKAQPELKQLLADLGYKNFLSKY